MFEARMAELEALARAQGLEFFPTLFEVVPQDIMTEIAAYGLPTRARHWSYGKVYQSQRLYGTMGLSKIYEIVLNSDPCQAFLLDTNPDLANLLVAAHVFGHADFFTNNVLFAKSNRQMVNDAVAHALRIDAYIERYGLETVEHVLGEPARIGRCLDHQRRHRRDDRRFRHARLAMARQIMHDFAAAGGMADMDGVLEIEMLRQGGEVVGIVIHVMAIADLGGPAVAAAVMGDDAEALVEEEEHLGVPIIRRERPAMAEDDGLALAPVLVEDVDAILGGDNGHDPDPSG